MQPMRSEKVKQQVRRRMKPLGSEKEDAASEE